MELIEDELPWFKNEVERRVSSSGVDILPQDTTFEAILQGKLLTCKMWKELEKQDMLRQKREDHERRKEEHKMMSEQHKQENKFQHDERRKMERREKVMKKELLRAERREHKEECC
ncbi:Homeodomain-like transcriptional regulator [Forsythia ovata]|uniref:Homeodomain-like transcriptional regulator n=1 Tax=Forsythia ovata TaxID=205694 RepID=A0ABD1PYG2_9LAMI